MGQKIYFLFWEFPVHASCLHVLLIISEYWKKIDRQKACSSLLPKVCLCKGWGNMRFLHSTPLFTPSPFLWINVLKHQIMKAGLMVRRLSYLGLDFQIKLKVQTGDPQGLLVSYLSYTPNKTKVTVKNNLF